MTKLEAIAFFMDMDECTYGSSEPIQMAIEALKQEPCEAISRQAAKERVMFVSRRKYELEKQWFEERIDQLEWLICKDEHEYVKVKAKKIADGGGYGDLYEDVYRCKRCGKVRE